MLNHLSHFRGDLLDRELEHFQELCLVHSQLVFEYVLKLIDNTANGCVRCVYLLLQILKGLLGLLLEDYRAFSVKSLRTSADHHRRERLLVHCVNDAGARCLHFHYIYYR